MNVSYVGKYTTWRAQTISLYDFVSSEWRSVDYRIISASVTSYPIFVDHPEKYISFDGKVRVRLNPYSNTAYLSYTDYLALIITP
jgi:hypothetical protein